MADARRPNQKKASSPARATPPKPPSSQASPSIRRLPLRETRRLPHRRTANSHPVEQGRRRTSSTRPRPTTSISPTSRPGTQAKRALTVAAAGDHNMLMLGPPGAGKTMLCAAHAHHPAPAQPRRSARDHAHLHRLRPMLEGAKALICTRARSAPRTTRSPTPASSAAAPSPPRAKSASPTTASSSSTNCPSSTAARSKSSASRSRTARVTISRAHGTITFPANFMLVAAMNPCPCGYFGDPQARMPLHRRRRSQHYLNRISGPLLDRIDIHVEVPAVDITRR